MADNSYIGSSFAQMSEGQVAEGAMSAAQADHDAELREQVTVT